MKKIYLAVIISIITIIGYMMELPHNINTDILKGNEIRVHFIDVGQGDSAFIELPDKKSMLIDAGEAYSGDKVVKYIKSLGYSNITYLVGTHPHNDHIGGLSKVIRSFDIKEIYMPKASNNTKTFENLLETIYEKNLSVNTAKKGVTIHSDETLNIKILSPVKETYKDLNNFSAVVKIEFKDVSFLFMGDAEKEVEDEIKNADVLADVIKVGHHGSDTSSSRGFINRVSPRYSVISVGEDNDYSHPHGKTLGILSQSEILRTDISGTIIMTTDGEMISVETEKY